MVHIIVDFHGHLDMFARLVELGHWRLLLAGGMVMRATVLMFACFLIRQKAVVFAFCSHRQAHTPCMY